MCIHILLTVGACFSEANADTESTSMSVGKCTTIFHLEILWFYKHVSYFIFHVRGTTFVKELYQYQTWKLLLCSKKRWSHCLNRDWCFCLHWMLLFGCLLLFCRSLTSGVWIAPKQFINSKFYQFVYIMIIIHSTLFLKFLFLTFQRTKKTLCSEGFKVPHYINTFETQHHKMAI